MSARTLASLMLAAALAWARSAAAAPCFATDGDDVYDKDGLMNGVVTVTADSESFVAADATPYDCTGRTFEIEADGKLTLGTNPATGLFAAVEFDSMTIAAGGLIESDAGGCPGGVASPGTGPDDSNQCVPSGPGSGTAGNDFGGAGGAGHGGGGGDGNAVGVGGGTYGSSIAPVRFGAGGGATPGTAAVGGTGGGIVFLQFTGTLTNDGTIRANGGAGAGTGNRVTGGGAGGSIAITAAQIEGDGVFAARGGDGVAAANTSGGGGGGRVAIVYGTGGFTFDALHFDVAGGFGIGGGTDGAKGTVYVRNSNTNAVRIFHGFTFADVDHVASSWVSDPSATNQHCAATLDSTATPSITATDVTFGGTLLCATAIASFTVQGTNTLALSDDAVLAVRGALTLGAGLDFAMGQGVQVSNILFGSDIVFIIPFGDDQVWTNVVIDGAPEGLFVIDQEIALTLGEGSSVHANAQWEVDSLTIDDGAIVANGKGCQGDAFGRAPDASNVCMPLAEGGGTNGNDFGGSGGGGHGGKAGDGNAVGTGGGTYGSATLPDRFGASGGFVAGAGGGVGGAGGGAVRLVVAGTFAHSGAIAANGATGEGGGGRVTGGGAGGSILVIAGGITGNGTFEARGADGIDGSTDGGGGGGGRIAVLAPGAPVELDAIDFDVLGGVGPDGAGEGAKGTVYLRDTTTEAVQIFHGFTFADEDYSASSWVSDSSATNQYCDTGIHGGATPSVSAGVITFGGALDCTTEIQSFTLTATGPMLAFSSGASFSANAAVTINADQDLAIGDGVTIRNTRRGTNLVLNVPSGDDQVWTDVTIDGALEGRFVIDDGIDLTLAGTTGIKANALFALGDLTIPQGTSLDATGKGCGSVKTVAPGLGARGPNASNVCATNGSGRGGNGNDFGGSGGGGHGGVGGAGNGGASGGGAYGDETDPVFFGASAGETGGTNALGGAGGGVIDVTLGGTLLHDGAIVADGGAGAGTGGRVTGGGGGGSIRIVAGGYACTIGGVFSAAGGAGADGDNDGGGGGGGRVRLQKTGVAGSCAALIGFTAETVAPGGIGPDGASDGATGTLSIAGVAAGTTTSTSTTVDTSSTTSSTIATTTVTTSTATSTTASAGTTTSTSSSSASTTTVPQGGCATEPQGPTFASIICRLEALAARIASETVLGAAGPKLAASLGDARIRTIDARARCFDSNARKTRTRLKQAVKRMTQFAHRLNGRAVRRTVPDALRQDLLNRGDAIRAHLRDLRGSVECPADASV